MSTETEPQSDPFRFGGLVTITYGAGDMPIIGVVREYGTYPAPWLQVEDSNKSRPIVFLGPGVVVRPA